MTSETEQMATCCLCKKLMAASGMWQSHDREGNLLRTWCSQCDDAERLSAYRKTNRITTRLMSNALMASLDKEYGKPPRPGAEVLLAVQQLVDAIQVEVRRFDRDVWFGGLQKIARGAKTKGTSFTAGDFKLLCYTMCGRAMITLDGPTSSLTLITAEDDTESRMGIQGIDATCLEAFALLNRAMKLWADGVRVTEDIEVRVAGT